MFDAFSSKTSAVLPDGPAAAAQLLEPALAAVAGPGAEPVSLTLDYAASARAGAVVTVEAGLDRATRTLAFAYARLVDMEGSVIATGAAVFRRVTEITKAA
jgi:acyl-coenzyme A thioesterase PaaI-like protein